MEALILSLPQLLSSATLLAGCGGNGPVDSAVDTSGAGVGEMSPGCAVAAPAVEVGVGAESFEPVSDGDPATLVHGPQGGWHVLASVRVSNTLDVVTITYTIHVLPEDTPVSWNQYRVQLVPHDSCTGDYAGMYGYLDVSALAEGEDDTPPELLEGRELELRLQVEDGEGRAAEDSVTVVGALDPADEAAGSGE